MPALLPSSDWTGLLPSPDLRATAGAFSAQGSSHADNEDCEYISPKHDLFIVADGMGGHFAGEQASHFVVDALAHELSRLEEYYHTPAEVKGLVRRALEEAHCLVVEMGDVLPQFRNARSTVTLALLFGSRLFVAGVGDSRAYMLRQGSLEQLTHDGFSFESQEAAGKLSSSVESTRSELQTHLRLKRLPVNQDIRVIDVRAKDRVLLCTDGVSDALADTDIRKILSSNRNCRLAARELVHEAVANGSSDDATALVLDIAAVNLRETNHVPLWSRFTDLLFGAKAKAIAAG